jgi:hypothetical protein
MKLQELAAKPKLIKAIIDDEKTVEKYGEAVEFWMYDRADLDTYFELAGANEKSIVELAKIVSKLVLDEKGTPVMTNDVVFPVDISIKIIEIAIKALGNSVTQTLKK